MEQVYIQYVGISKLFIIQMTCVFALLYADPDIYKSLEILRIWYSHCVGEDKEGISGTNTKQLSQTQQELSKNGTNRGDLSIYKFREIF